MKSVISAFLIAVVVTACSAQSTPPIHPITTTNAAQGVSKVVQTSNGAQIFINGELTDVIKIEADGSAAHSISGRRVVDHLKATYAPGGKTPFAHRGSNDCIIDKANMNAANANYYAATAAMILALGAGVAADVMTWGVALALSGASAVAVMNWAAAVEARNAAYLTAQRDRC
jgi:hypothetical protein